MYKIVTIILSLVTTSVLIQAQPSASFTVSPSTASCEVSMQFDASASYSNGHDIIRYEWDFDYDGTFNIQAVGEIVEHSYSRMKVTGSGESISILPYTVALRVTDDNDPAGTDIIFGNATLSFTNHTPFADAGDNTFSTLVSGTPASVILNGKDSYDPDGPCDEVVSYKWDTDGDGLFGSDDNDGGLCEGQECEGAVISILNEYWMYGSSSTIELRVVDSYGLVSNSSEAIVNIIDINSIAPAINDLIINKLVTGDAQFELQVSHPELAPQTFDCSFYLLPEDIEITAYDEENNPITQINYAGNNVNQSVLGNIDFTNKTGSKQLKVVITMSDSRESEKITRSFGIDNVAPSNPTDCVDYGTTSGSCTNDNDPYFVWSGASDNYSDVLKYYYYWGTDPAGQSEINLATYNGYDPEPMTGEGEYYLRINTEDEAGNHAGWTTLYTYIYSQKPSPFVITGQSNVAPDQTEIYLVPDDANVNYAWDVINGVITDEISDNTVEIQWDDALSGEINVFSENLLGCRSDISVLEINIKATAVDDMPGNEIDVYPNPVTDIVNISCDEEFIAELCDIYGSMVLMSSDKEIDVSDITPGVYILVIKNNTNKPLRIFKIIKK